MTDGGLVIVGAGQAGYQLASSARDEGYGEAITLIGAEAGLPYERPPLSKEVLLGQPAKIEFRPEHFFTDKRIELVTGRVVTEIDRIGRTVKLDDGSRVGYDHLALATGAVNKSLALPGTDLDGVVSLRTRAEAAALASRLQQIDSIAIVGAGFIGLEIAAAASKRGVRVDVIEAADRVMARCVSPAVSDYTRRHHEHAGVTFHFGCRPVCFRDRQGAVTGTELDNGAVLDADLVVVGIGVTPSTTLAELCNLPVDDGIVVDRFLNTADPCISALGDCAAFPSMHTGRQLRLESVQNACDQALVIADGLTGNARPYNALPWFWSDQGELKLQMAGFPVPCDRHVLRGDPESGSFAVFGFSGGMLLGVETINRPADHAAGKRLLMSNAPISPEEIADPSTSLKALVSRGREGAS